MSVQTQIDRISGNVSAALSAIAEKGVTVPDGSNSDALAGLIASIEAGGDSVFSKAATGTITPSSSTSTLTIEHGMGVLPHIAILYCTHFNTTSVMASIVNSAGKCFNVGCPKGTYMGYNGSVSPEPNAKTITFVGRLKSASSGNSSAYTFSPSFEYTWIAGVFA